MKKIMIFLVIIIAAVTVLAGCSGQGYVNRARKYIAEKYDGLEVEHVLVRGDENGYASGGYYYTHWNTVSDPIVEFVVIESSENNKYAPGQMEKGTLIDDYEMILIEENLIGKVEEHIEPYLDNVFYVTVWLRDPGGVDRLPQDIRITEDDFLKLTYGNHTITNKYDKNKFNGKWEAYVQIHIDIKDAKDISAEEMYEVIEKLYHSGALGDDPAIIVSIEDRMTLMESKLTGEMVVDPKSLVLGITVAEYPKREDSFIEKREEFISTYNTLVEFRSKPRRRPS